MKRFLQTLALIAAMMMPTVAAASGLQGDIDGDGKVNIDDVTALISYLLSGNEAPAAADCDMDGKVNIDDVTTLINYLLSGNWPATPQEGDWVDLGLPSGTIWATRNIGADTPEGHGDYFAWGETEPKDYYDMNTYKWGYIEDLGEWRWTKYYYDYYDYSSDSNIPGDNKTELDPEDDAAYVNWGIEARMPSWEQIQELENSCTWQWTTRNGVYGHLGTGPNGNTIFLPAAGYRWNESLENVGSYGYYWSLTLNQYNSSSAYYLFFVSDGLTWIPSRDIGFTVRAVRAPEENHEYVDLGLPSGTLWATCNIGASAPEEYGDYFAWGETDPKDYYDWSTYKWCNGSSKTLTKYCTDSSYGYNGFVDNKTELDPEDDAAYVNWGPSWRMPTSNQYSELCGLCTWEWTQRNGVNGRLVTGPNGKTLFLPAAGMLWNDYLYDSGSTGHYWSRTLYYKTYDAYLLLFGSVSMHWYDFNRRSDAQTVRAVRVL